MDEKGFVLGQALKVKVICRKGRRNPRYGNREMVTVIECVSADGSVLPPMYIYKGPPIVWGGMLQSKLTRRLPLPGQKLGGLTGYLDLSG